MARLSLLKKGALTLFLLSTISLFLPVGESIEKLLTYISYIILVILYLINGNISIPLKGKIFVYFLFSIIFSVIPAKIYWGQSIAVSLIAILPFFIYSLYLILYGLRIEKIFLIKILCIIGKIYPILYLIKYIFPELPIGIIVIDGVRGDRVVVPGEFFNYFLYFTYLYRFIKRPSRNLAFWIILSLIVIILPMTRQRIVLILLLSIIMIIYNVNKKYLKVIIPSLFIMGGLIISGPFFTKLSEMTNEQMNSENPYDHIRELGILYYFSEFPHKGLNYVIGNGVPSYGRSQYGNESKVFAESTKIYLIDIGFAGIFNYFGLIGLSLYIIMILKFALCKKQARFSFCKYFLFLILGSSVLSGVPLIPSQFMFIGICAYLLTPNNYGRKYNNNQLQYSSISH